MSSFLSTGGWLLTFESERSSSSPLMSNYFTSWSDYWIGRLSAGTHTLKIVVDTEDAVSESNERDNEYSKNHYGSAVVRFPVAFL